MSELVLINGRLIDGTGKEPLDDCGIVVKGANISAVGPSQSLPVPADAQVIDVGGRTIMPGLIDAHTHLTYHYSEYRLLLQQLNESLEMNTIKAIQSAKIILETGCTAIADGGSRGSIGIAVRDAVSQGLIPGPKVAAAGQIICGSAGIMDHTFTFGYVDDDVFLGTAVNGPQEVRTTVRKQVRQGVDYVKVAASGVPGSKTMDGKTQDLSYEEVLAAVQEASKFGKRVHAHAHDSSGIKDVIRSGVMSLHSGEFVDEEGLHLMKDMDCVFVPTIAWLHFRSKDEYAREPARATKASEEEIEWFIQDCREAYEACREAIVKAYRIGTPIAIGSDGAHVFPPFDVVYEMEYFQELGVPPLEIITAATKMAAKAIGRSDVWGTLEPGKAADILVVDGDPSQNISVLRDKSHIVMMLQDGRVAKDIMAKKPTKV
jgi:imidazolonepropionase-like amidohydrolase